VPLPPSRPRRLTNLIRDAYGGDGQPVVLSSRSDFLKISPMYRFNQWHAIYAPPAGEFWARLEFTRRLARERDAKRFAALARGNRFDPIDVFVLRSTTNGRLVYKVFTVDFPYGHRTVRIPFDEDQFAHAYWQTVEVGPWFIAAPR